MGHNYPFSSSHIKKVVCLCSLQSWNLCMLLVYLLSSWIELSKSTIREGLFSIHICLCWVMSSNREVVNSRWNLYIYRERYVFRGPFGPTGSVQGEVYNRWSFEKFRSRSGYWSIIINPLTTKVAYMQLFKHALKNEGCRFATLLL